MPAVPAPMIATSVFRVRMGPSGWVSGLVAPASGFLSPAAAPRPASSRAMADPAALLPEQLRFAEVMVCFAAACELAMGQSADHALHSGAVALRLGRAAGLGASELRDVFYQSLLRFIGCNADT